MAVTKSEQERFEANPSLFIENTIKEYITGSPKNCFQELDEDGPIFDEPLVGFADGDDPIFEDYKTIIGDFHLTPREALTMYLQSKGIKDVKQPEHLSVIAWVLPIARETRLSVRRESVVTSLRWNHTRWHGEALNKELSHYLVSLLEELERLAAAPMYTNFWKEQKLPDGPSSNWSHRHMVYAAGLGTFSLNDAVITPKGIAVRCGSAVVDLALPPSPRIYANHLSNCLFYHDKSCRRCIERCPVDAITEQGHDKIKCREFLMTEQKEILKKLGRDEGYIGTYVGCGLCQTKVPCEDRIPPGISGKDQHPE